MLKEPIIVAGAGPVGLTIADILSLEGIPVRVLEKESSPSNEWRASTFHAGTLELLESTGVTEELIKLGIKATKVQYRDRNEGLFAEFDFDTIKDETKYPFRLQCPQSTYTYLVYERLLERSNVEFMFKAEVLDFEQDDKGVTVYVQTSAGIKTMRTSYLLAADGGRSTIRKRLGVKFEGYTLPERFLLTSTNVDFTKFLPDIGLVNYIADPEEFLFVLKVPEAWRLLFPIPPEMSDEKAMDDENLQRTYQRALHTDRRFPIIEHRIYRVHQRVADRFYDGRVILLGDAAHLNSPMGGLGLNGGIHDAVDLSRRMIRILNGETDVKAELDKYSEVRRSVYLEYIRQMSERNTNVMRETDPELRKKLQQEYIDQAADPEQHKAWVMRSAMITSIREKGIGEPPAVATR
jgi:3-(3-hydroxy-phenyl)propionate hydroxylase